MPHSSNGTAVAHHHRRSRRLAAPGSRLASLRGGVTLKALAEAWPTGPVSELARGLPASAQAQLAAPGGDASALRLSLALARSGAPLPPPGSAAGGVTASRFTDSGGEGALLLDGGDMRAVLAAKLGAPVRVPVPRGSAVDMLARHVGILCWEAPHSTKATHVFALWDGKASNATVDLFGESEGTWPFELPRG